MPPGKLARYQGFPSQGPEHSRERKSRSADLSNESRVEVYAFRLSRRKPGSRSLRPTSFVGRMIFSSFSPNSQLPRDLMEYVTAMLVGDQMREFMDARAGCR